MPVDLQWHSELPLLVATYTGALTPKAYYAMRDQRQAMLNDSSDQVVLLANLQDLETVRDADSLKRNDAVVFDQSVMSTLIVLPADLYRRVMRAVDAERQQQFPVQFFSDISSALDAASQMVGSPN